MYCTEESVGSQRECEKTVNIDTSGDSVKAGILHSLRGTVAISEVTVHDAELMAIVGFSVSWRSAPQTGLHAMLPVAEQNNGLPSGM
ncbi:ABC transporter [Bacillus subtilis]|uniref:ABC transporter n=1 Tax=Bacillus subtilis TaxID=1423 RepID=UPI003F4DB5DD